MTKDDAAVGASARRPRLLYLAMYDPAGQDSAPKVRIRLLAEALERRADVDMLTGARFGRVGPMLRWLRSGGLGRIDAVYVESPSSTVTPFDLAFLALARLRRRPVGVYFRDAYQLHRDLYPFPRRRQRLADLAWHASTPLLRAVASVRFAPTAGLARVLGLGDPVLLPPGSDPSADPVPVGERPIVGYVGSTTREVGFDLLVDAMRLVRESVPNAELRVIARPRAGAPPWVSIRPGSRTEALRQLADARATVLPLPINRYTDLTFAVKIMDYLGLGKPIVATRTVETAAFLEGTGAALLVDDTPADLAAAIVRVLVEPGLAEAMAESAAALARQPELTWDGRAAVLLDALLGAAARAS